MASPVWHFAAHLSLKSSRPVCSKSSGPTGDPALTPHPGTHGAIPFFSFCSRLLLLPLLPLTPAFPTPSPFVHPPKPAVQGSDAVCYRHASQEVPSQSTKLRRESVCLSAKENEAQEETETVKRMYLNLE